MVGALQDQRCPALTEDEPVALGVERPAGRLGSSLRVERAPMALNPATTIRANGASLPPAIMTSASPRRMIAAASPIACAELAQAETGAKLGPFAPVTMATVPEAMFAEKHRHEEWTQSSRTRREHGLHAGVERLSAAHARSDQNSDPFGVGIVDRQPRLLEGLQCRRDSKVRIAVCAARILSPQTRHWVEFLDFAGKRRLIAGWIETGEPRDARRAGENGLPRRASVVTHRRDDAKSCHHDAAPIVLFSVAEGHLLLQGHALTSYDGVDQFAQRVPAPTSRLALSA